MKKRVPSALLALVMLLTMLPVYAAAEVLEGECGETCDWTLDTDTGVLTIRGDGAMEDYTDQAAPWSALPVTRVVVEEGITAIGSSAFRRCGSISDITLPDTLTTIYPSSLEGTAIRTITIPASVAYLGEYAFLNCASLEIVFFEGDVPICLQGDATALEPLQTGNLSQIFFCCKATIYYPRHNETWTADVRDSFCGANNGTTTQLYFVGDHDWADAACTAPKTCIVCGTTQGEPLGHSGAWTTTQMPTCYSEGEKRRVCTVCGITETEVLPITDHEPVELPAVAPTCTETGLTEGRQCSICDEITAAQTVIPALGHDLHSQMIRCQARTTCSRCGYEENRGGATAPGWVHDMVGYSAAKDRNITGAGVVVGIVDSGLSDAFASHSRATVLEGTNYLVKEGDPDRHIVTDEVGHGTAVAAILADEHFGLAPDVTIVPLKAFDSKTGTYAAIAEAIYDAVDVYHCDVLNLSLGGTVNDPTMAAAVQYALDHDVIVVAAAGNRTSYAASTGNDPYFYPAAQEGVISVGAVDSAKNITRVSTQNDRLSVTAPGYQVPILTTGGSHSTGGGTSYAAPYVTAVAALVRSVMPELSADEFARMLYSAAEDLGAEGYDNTYGHGLVQLDELLSCIGHTEHVLPGKAATCTEDGLTEGKQCTVCGEVTVRQDVIAAKGHTEQALPGKDVTCTEDGLTEGSRCTVCSEVLVKQEVIPAPGHDLQKADADGRQAKQCSRCDFSASVSGKTVTVTLDEGTTPVWIWAALYDAQNRFVEIVMKEVTGKTTALTFESEIKGGVKVFFLDEHKRPQLEALTF